MNRAMSIVFLSCRKATELVERKIHFGGLSRTDQIQLHFHSMICKFCSAYEKQSLLIEKSMATSSKKILGDEDLAQLKKMILDKLDSLNRN